MNNSTFTDPTFDSWSYSDDPSGALPADPQTANSDLPSPPPTTNDAPPDDGSTGSRSWSFDGSYDPSPQPRQLPAQPQTPDGTDSSDAQQFPVTTAQRKLQAAQQAAADSRDQTTDTLHSLGVPLAGDNGTPFDLDTTDPETLRAHVDDTFDQQSAAADMNARRLWSFYGSNDPSPARALRTDIERRRARPRPRSAAISRRSITSRPPATTSTRSAPRSWPATSRTFELSTSAAPPPAGHPSRLLPSGCVWPRSPIPPHRHPRLQIAPPTAIHPRPTRGHGRTVKILLASPVSPGIFTPMPAGIPPRSRDPRRLPRTPPRRKPFTWTPK